MKHIVRKIGLLVFLFTIFVPFSILAQQKMEVMLQNNGESICDSMHTSYRSTMFDLDNMDLMHKELDRIFSALDDSLRQKMNAGSFNMDSLARYFDFNFDFNGDLDSLMSIRELRNNNKFLDLDTLLKYHYGINDLNKISQEDNYNHFHPSPYSGMNIEVTTDTINEDGNVIITKKVIIVSNDSLHTNNSNEYKGENDVDSDGKVTNTYKEGFRHPNKHIKIESGKSEIKTSGTSENKKYISNIDISDSELLVKAGISSKIITSPALKPSKVGVNVKVENKYGKEMKDTGLSIDFKDTAPIHVIILDKDGNNIYEERQKSFTGTYTHHVELNEILEPYYFLIIRNKKLFGRKLYD